jgi:hypothetical protein
MGGGTSAEPGIAVVFNEKQKIPHSEQFQYLIGKS